MKTTQLSSFLCISALALVACGRREMPSEIGRSDAPRPSSTEPTLASTTPAETPSQASTSDASESAPSRAGNTDRTSIASVADATAAQSGTSTTAEPTADAPTRTPDVIYVPTPQPVVDKMLEIAQVKKDDIVYDLGCGDGRIVVTAAKRYGVKSFGFDIDPQRVMEARANVRAAKVEHLVTIEQKDIFTLDLSPASVVTLYLLPALNVRLIPQLEKLKPGSRIVSHDFNMEGVTPLKHLTMTPKGASEEHDIYFWKTPFVKQ
jgi:precorrin-6B methylase 2